MPITTTTLLVAGVAMAAAGAAASGIAANNEAKFKAADERQRAVREREIAAEKEKDFRRDTSKTAAQSRANQGGSGTINSTGSSLLAQSEFGMEEELQALRIRAGGEVSASRLEDSARLNIAAGKNEQTQGFFRAGSTLLSGGGKIFA